jgi:hypothetical protein
VVQAAGVSEAQRALAEIRFDAVITDQKRPTAKGWMF